MHTGWVDVCMSIVSLVSIHFLLSSLFSLLFSQTNQFFTHNYLLLLFHFINFLQPNITEHWDASTALHFFFFFKANLDLISLQALLRRAISLCPWTWILFVLCHYHCCNNGSISWHSMSVWIAHAMTQRHFQVLHLVWRLLRSTHALTRIIHSEGGGWMWVTCGIGILILME